MKKENNMSLKHLTKSSVWEIQENDVFRLWEAVEKDADLNQLRDKAKRLAKTVLGTDPYMKK